MKNFTILTIFALLVAGVSVPSFAYEGATKFVAAMTHPERSKAEAGPISVVPSYEMNPGKMIQGYLTRIPEPTLSIERIREEKPGFSRGTKPVILFQKYGKV